MTGSPGKQGGGSQVPQLLTEHVFAPLATSIFVGSILLSTFLQVLIAVLVFKWPSSPLSWTAVAMLVTLTVLPLREPPEWAAALISFSCRAAEGYFQCRVVVEDAKGLTADKPYVVALEPHSALPTAIPVAFGMRSQLLPEALRGRTHGLVSSVCFKVPIVRHLYYWWGFRPITGRCMRRLLSRNRSVVMVPGGVQECLLMEHEGVEVAFLRKRKGFIRVAMQSGADIVPAFAFGQSQTYKWLRPGPPLFSQEAVKALSRQIGMVPLVLLGRWGSPVPHRSRLTVVLGPPMRLPQHDSPSDEVLQHYLDIYISQLEGMFERHKAAAGHPGLQLRVM